ncbi:hypothetical protein BDY24DRAFT_380744, partial [Mrakia frigida]|uniref:uncharacterized protein n=1 Tax=Mrakia frigida TaxID=29902 RepID=UPI003FCBF853
MLLFSLLCSSLLLLSAQPSQALNWTSTRTTPAFSKDGGERIRGVNLGGWFVLENWMQSNLFAVPPLDLHTVTDEWTYTKLLGKEEASKRLTSHWNSCRHPNSNRREKAH